MMEYVFWTITIVCWCIIPFQIRGIWRTRKKHKLWMIDFKRGPAINKPDYYVNPPQTK